VLEPAVIALRLLQYAGAMILFGSSLFALYALPAQGFGSAPETRWFRPLLIWSGVGLFLASLAGLVAQTSVLAGSFGEGLKLSSLGAVVGMGLGRAALIRAVAAALAVAVLVARKADRNALVVSAALGGIICASFAWMGHGAATEGPGGAIHLVSDILHALAAGVWVGALVAFGGLLCRRAKSVQLDGVLHTALDRFSGVGSGLVAVLVASGLVNSWFLVGPERLSGMWTTPYGQLLSLKLLLFVGMLALAAANRFRLTPALGAALAAGTREPALRALRRSLMLETGLAVAVLGLVAWFGMLAPVSAQ
jgi:putative copper resistance protein D